MQPSASAGLLGSADPDKWLKYVRRSWETGEVPGIGAFANESEDTIREHLREYDKYIEGTWIGPEGVLLHRLAEIENSKRRDKS